MTQPARYAADTVVPVDRSKRQIEDLLKSRKVEGYHTGWDQDRDIIEFLWQGKQIRFVLKRPTSTIYNQTKRQYALEQADRQRWRALYLVVRAKIEAVEAGLAIFEEEFLAFIVMPNGRTVGEILVPRLQDGTIGKHLLPAGKVQAGEVIDG